MALFTDGAISSVGELAEHDSQLLTVATVEGIDVTRKAVLAQEELALELEVLLEPWMRLEHVVVTPPLRLWHAYRCLEMVYQDAYNNQLNDRYANKRDEFRQMARWAMDRFLGRGVGVAGHPVPRAGRPSVMATPGTLPDGTYYVAVSWLNAEGEEGATSEAVGVTTASSSFLVRPLAASPEGREGDPEGNLEGEPTAGWNVYAGVDPLELARQNQTPNPMAASWVQPGELLTSGKRPSPGQAPSYMRRVARRLQRG